MLTYWLIIKFTLESFTNISPPDPLEDVKFESIYYEKNMYLFYFSDRIRYYILSDSIKGGNIKQEGSVKGLHY